MKYEIMPCADQDGDYIDEMICEYNLAQVPADPRCAFGWCGKKATDGEGNLIGGCTAIRTVWGTAEIDFLRVDEAYRMQGIGSQLLHEVEQVIKESDCTVIQVDTFDWQAKGFYEKNGYSIFGTLEDCPKGHCRYYMKKSL